MRGNSDTSGIYPFQVKEIKSNKPISDGGYAVFNVPTQEFVPGLIYKTEGEAQAKAHSLKQGGV